VTTRRTLPSEAVARARFLRWTRDLHLYAGQRAPQPHLVSDYAAAHANEGSRRPFIGNHGDLSGRTPAPLADALHKLTGVRMDDPSQRRDWLLTRIWTIAMDGLAIGLVIMVSSGLYLWVRRERRRLPGLLSLALGTTACAVFVFVLAHIASP
jgi:hypothetical protein